MQLPVPPRELAVVAFPGLVRAPIASLDPEAGYCLRPLSKLPLEEQKDPRNLVQENNRRIVILTAYRWLSNYLEAFADQITPQFRFVESAE